MLLDPYMSGKHVCIATGFVSCKKRTPLPSSVEWGSSHADGMRHVFVNMSLIAGASCRLGVICLLCTQPHHQTVQLGVCPCAKLRMCVMGMFLMNLEEMRVPHSQHLRDNEEKIGLENCFFRTIKHGRMKIPDRVPILSLKGRVTRLTNFQHSLVGRILTKQGQAHLHAKNIVA